MYNYKPITLTEQTKEFLSLLWRGAPGKQLWAYYYFIDEQRTYTTPEGEIESVKESAWFPANKIMRVPHKPTAHVYFGVNPTTVKRNDRQRAIMDVVASVGALFAEWDVADWQNKEAILEWIATLPRKPSVLIDSGGGYHGYFLLDEPFIIETDEQRQYIKGVSRRWVRACEGDDVKDLTRVLRLPGSKNIKPKYAPEYPAVAYVYCNLDTRYSLADLVSILPADQDEERARVAPRSDTTTRSALNGQGSMIDHYNENVSVESRLEAAGYVRRGKRYVAPNADKSTNSSVVILDDNCSYHWDTADVLADEHKHSAFDLYCHFEHGGNAKAAVKAYMRETGAILDVDMVNGVACCPIHHVPLPRAANGNGYKCHQRDGNEWCAYYWKGEGHVMPDSNTLIDSNESRATLRLTPEDVVTASGQPDRARFTPRCRTELNSVKPPKWLLKNEVVAGGYGLTYGPSGSGKTFYKIDVVRRVLALNIGPVIYIATEDTAGLKVRVLAQEIAHGTKFDNFLWIDQDLDLSNPADVDDLIAGIRPFKPVYVVVDTMREAYSGDENSSQDMRAINRAVHRIIEATGAAVDLVHHTGVNEGRERGSSALTGNLDIKLKITMDDDLIVVTPEKIKNGRIVDSAKYRLTEIDTGLVNDENERIMTPIIRPAADVTMRGASLTPRQRLILETLSQEVFRESGAKGSQLMGAHKEIAQSSFYGLLSKLMRLGFIRQGKKGDPFYITEKGRDEIAPEYLEAPDPGYTPVGYEGDSQNEIPQQYAHLQDSSGLSSDSHDTTNDPSHTPLDSSTPTLISLRDESGESQESDRKEESELFDDEQPPSLIDTQATAQASDEPRNTIDTDFVRRMIALKDMAAIQRHCAMNWFNGIRPAPLEQVIEYADPQPLELD
jgi:hypothetical protein